MGASNCSLNNCSCHQPAAVAELSVFILHCTISDLVAGHGRWSSQESCFTIQYWWKMIENKKTESMSGSDVIILKKVSWRCSKFQNFTPLVDQTLSFFAAGTSNSSTRPGFTVQPWLTMVSFGPGMLCYPRLLVLSLGHSRPAARAATEVGTSKSRSTGRALVTWHQTFHLYTFLFYYNSSQEQHRNPL